MKSITRNLLFHVTIAMAAVLTSSSAHAGDNPFTNMWPFGKSKKPTPSFTKPVSFPQKPNGNSLLNGPSRLLDKAEKQTNSFFNKTKKGMRDVQDFGKSMNPFAKQKQNKKSLLDSIFPKQKVETGPATVGEFLNMKRPKF